MFGTERSERVPVVIIDLIYIQSVVPIADNVVKEFLVRCPSKECMLSSWCISLIKWRAHHTLFDEDPISRCKWIILVLLAHHAKLLSIGPIANLLQRFVRFRPIDFQPHRSQRGIDHHQRRSLVLVFLRKMWHFETVFLFFEPIVPILVLFGMIHLILVNRLEERLVYVRVRTVTEIVTQPRDA